MRIWHISDTHGLHQHLYPPAQVDLVIHSGDATTDRKPELNLNQHREFMEWFGALPIPHKIYVPGNHDFSASTSLHLPDMVPSNVQVLIDVYTEIEGLLIAGVPWTRKWGRWVWQVDNEYELANKFAQFANINLDILVTHGPPSGFLDERADGSSVGSTALREFIQKEKVRATLFGHVHNEHEVINTGVIQISSSGEIVSNAAAVSNTSSRLFTGNIIDINEEDEPLFTPGKFIEPEF